jgi:hypothetical protein
MAFQQDDPCPFTPRGFQAMEIHQREFMVRSVVSHPETMHEDYAIISFNPLPAHPMHFGPVRDVIHEFLEDHMRVAIRDVQPTHLG